MSCEVTICFPDIREELTTKERLLKITKWFGVFDKMVKYKGLRPPGRCVVVLHYYTWSYWDVNAVSTLRMMRDPKKTATIVLANRLQEVMALEVIELKLSEPKNILNTLDLY